MTEFQVTLSMPIDGVETPEEAIRDFVEYILGGAGFNYVYTVDDGTGNVKLIDAEGFVELDENGRVL